ncbi:TadE/TadG family type IV pilus assembly protein [Aurantiacibacter sp. D1-12]|uniref:TadE/TadG family type IV pilus assembly protein n=1 Tax=Aurantiacibacter sp. D1-12 TaxID=2993658 RepID=UPI00237CB4A5|nr:TadE/TadG family type IV pilus assembly protein [Aurantiacibacter sp. D1-12]MDE1467684.1 pilus assembly protein [Aurantiacibacter sp. D1-12]
MANKGIIGRIARDDEGAAIVEFGFIALPLILILLAGVDFGHRTYVSSVMQGSLTDAARRASVENPNIGGSGSTLEERVAEAVEAQVSNIVTSGYTLTVEQSNFYDFTGIGNPEKIVRDNDGDGVYDEDDGDCFSDLNENGEFDTDTGRSGRGGANDVVFYEATLEMDALVPLANFLGGESRYTMVAETAIRNQPWGTQATPPTICGTAI